MSVQEKYLEIMRQKTPEERLKIGLNWTKFVRDTARQGIRWQYPGISKAELKKKLQERIALTKYLDKYGPSLCSKKSHYKI